MDAEAASSRGRAGTERGSHHRTRGGGTRPWTHLLFSHLSAGHHAGHLRMVGQEGEEEPLHVLEGSEVATLSDAGGIRRCTGGWRRFVVPVVSTLLCLRSHCHEFVATCLAGRQQRVGSCCRALRQLCLLSLEHLAARPTLAYHCCHHADSFGGIGLAQRTHLLQHRLSCGHATQFLQPFLVPEDSFRHREVSQLLAVYQELQGSLHRLQDTHGGL